MNIAYIDGGTYYHHDTFHDPELNPYFAANIYAPELYQTDLSSFDALYIASRQDSDDLLFNQEKILHFLDAGKTVVVAGDNAAEQWVPGAQWTDEPVNFWWWLTPGEDSGLRLAAPEHALMRTMTLQDFTWHHHGFFTPPDGAVSIINTTSGGSVFYEDTVSTKGRLFVTSLDPCYHHGSHFMPAASRLLRGFLPWLHRQ
ncbi:MAG: hypothetical protein LBG61_03605 [Burkholderiales bacterium]|nr:hypothetical protein [Burkholderiales bacterium]